jgi:hypothetical protein
VINELAYLENIEKRKGDKQARKVSKERKRQANKKQILPHVLRFERYPLSHKSSHDSSKGAKKVK